MRESDIEKKIVTFARSLGFLVFKFTSPSNAGVPDRLFISPAGAVLFLEIKAPKKKPTPLQMHTIQKLRDQGVAAWWTDSVADGWAMIDVFKDFPKTFNRIYHGPGTTV